MSASGRIYISEEMVYLLQLFQIQ